MIGTFAGLASPRRPRAFARLAWLALLPLLGVLAPEAEAQISYKVRITNNNLVGLTTTNYGFFGNNFTSRSPSFEYPLGTGYEHMVRGGLWIGGLTQFSGTGEDLRVSTAAVDGSQGSASASGTEYTPLGNQIFERSKLPNSPTFSPLAVSEQDFVTEFADYPGKPTVTGGEDHVPLGIKIEQRTFNWSFSRFANFVAVSLKITNTGPPLRNVWVGMYEEFATGPKNAYSNWPPSSTGSTLGSWFNKKKMGYVADARLITEHYCRSYVGGEATCDNQVAPPWVGIQLLGIRPDTVANKQISVYFANWTPGDTTRDEDDERYNILSTGRITPPDSLLPGFSADGGANDPTSILAVGPFDEILPDSSITVDFAWVGGSDEEDLIINAAFAQLAFNFNYVIPEPPPSPRLAIVPSDGALDLYWDRSSELATDPTSPQPGNLDFEGYRIYVGEDRGRLSRYAQYDRPDTTGFDTGFAPVALGADSVNIDGTWYHYRQRVSGLKTGFKYFAAVTAYDIGDDQIESLESGITQNLAQAVPAPSPSEAVGRKVTVFPNPYKVEAKWDAGSLVRDHYLWFANLPQRCTIRIYTLAGDLLKSFAFDGATYDGSSARGLFNPGAEAALGAPELSGSLYAWDLITDQGQAAASGLYIYSIEDATTGEVQRGKFLILKSDKEGFQ